MSLHGGGGRGHQSSPILNPIPAFYYPGYATYSYMKNSTRLSCRWIFTNADIKGFSKMVLETSQINLFFPKNYISFQYMTKTVWVIILFPIAVRHGCPCIGSSSTQQRQGATFACSLGQQDVGSAAALHALLQQHTEEKCISGQQPVVVHFIETDQLCSSHARRLLRSGPESFYTYYWTDRGLFKRH